MLAEADIIVMNHCYMLDPKLKHSVQSSLDECIIVFDECQGLDQTCVDLLSMHLTIDMLEQASQSVKQLEELSKQQKDSEQLKQEYTSFLKDTEVKVCTEHEIYQEQLFAADELNEKMPGNLRRPLHFLPVLRKIIVYFKQLMSAKEMQVFSPLVLVGQLQEKYFIDQRSLKFV